MKKKQVELSDFETELNALKTVYLALSGLTEEARDRVIVWMRDFFDQEDGY